MNIFFVDEDPYIAAQSLVDSHVVKMILESCQMLSTAHRVLDGTQVTVKQNGRNLKKWVFNDSRDKIIYQATHINHPCAKWTRHSIENYNWLVDHLHGLLQEYTFRYGKKHKCEGLLLTLQCPPLNLKEFDFTYPPCAMPTEYIVDNDPVSSYRNYYIHGKRALHAYKKRAIPNWLT